MKMMLSDLPDGIEERDVEELVAQYAEVESVELLDKGEPGHLECLVTLGGQSSRAGADAVAEKLNGQYWKETRIRAALLLFDDDDEDDKGRR